MAFTRLWLLLVIRAAEPFFVGEHSPQRRQDGPSQHVLKKTTVAMTKEMTMAMEEDLLPPETALDRCWAAFSESLEGEMPRSVGEALLTRGITVPTAIQEVVMAPLLRGESALVCAETGSGKSVAFLLPALLRTREEAEASVLVLAPTRELAVQLATEASRLSTALFGVDAVELLAPGTATTVGGLRGAKCVVATPKEFLLAFQGRPALLPKLAGVATIVLDEVDALLPPKEKKDYRSDRSKERLKRKTEAKSVVSASERKKRQLAAEATRLKYPTAAVLDLLLKTNGRRDLQLVGASATASRTTRDSLDKLATGDDPYGRFRQSDSIPVLRPKEEILLRGEAAPRTVVVPSVVTHKVFDLEKKAPLSVGAKAIAQVLEKTRPKSALVFLTEASGYTVVKMTAALGDLLRREEHAKKEDENDDPRYAVSALHDRLFGWEDDKAAPTKEEEEEGTTSSRILSKRRLREEARRAALKQPPPRRTQELEATRLDLAKEFEQREDQSTSPVLVTFEATARGLHFDAVDLVVVVGLPKTSGSYLHLAGRTGRRLGDDTVPGTVVTLCAPKAQAVLNSWSKQLGDVRFDPLE